MGKSLLPHPDLDCEELCCLDPTQRGGGEFDTPFPFF